MTEVPFFRGWVVQLKSYTLGLLLLPVVAVFSCRDDIVDGKWPLPEIDGWYVLGSMHDTIRGMDQSAQFIWIATQNNGLVRCSKSDGSLKYFNTTTSTLPDNFLTSVLVEHESSIWIGSEHKGLIHFDGDAFEIFDTTSGYLPHHTVRALALDSTGDLWVGTLGGLAKLQGGHSTHYTSQNTNGQLPDPLIQSLGVAPDGSLWIGTRTSGLVHLQGAQWKHYDPSDSPLTDPFIRTFFWHDRTMWFSSFQSFYSIKDMVWEVFSKENTGIVSPYVNDLAITDSARKYFATHEGFSIWDPEGGWKNFVEELPHPICEQVLIDENGLVWVGTFGGLAVYKPEGVDAPW
ncbi:MAG: hypothetical protein H6606_05835 [Flavobacteriales bacterium]|nr:hypothetical protein [Flavobacteriales bacterium]